MVVPRAWGQGVRGASLAVLTGSLPGLGLGLAHGTEFRRPGAQPPDLPIMVIAFFFFLIFIYVWLCQVLVGACGIFIAACGIFSCGVQTS